MGGREHATAECAQVHPSGSHFRMKTHMMFMGVGKTQPPNPTQPAPPPCRTQFKPPKQRKKRRHFFGQHPYLRPDFCRLLVSTAVLIVGVTFLLVGMDGDWRFTLVGALLGGAGAVSLSASTVGLCLKMMAARKRAALALRRRRRRQKRSVTSLRPMGMTPAFVDPLMLRAVCEVHYRACDEAWERAQSSAVSSPGPAESRRLMIIGQDRLPATATATVTDMLLTASAAT